MQEEGTEMIDKEIVEMICHRDENAIKRLQMIYGRKMYYVSLSVTGHHEDAEECCNDCLYVLWKNIPSARPTHLWQYIKTVVYRISMDKKDYNLAQKRREFCREELEENEIKHINNEIENSIEKMAILSALNDFMELLTEEKKDVFIKKYAYDYLVEEIAVRRNFSVSKVKMMLFRMRKELKKQLKEENIFL